MAKRRADDQCASCGAGGMELRDVSGRGKLCPDCRRKLEAGDDCRCKESIGKTPGQMLLRMARDLRFWKR